MIKKEKYIIEILNFLKENNFERVNLKKAFVWNSKDNCRGKIFVSIHTTLDKKYHYLNESINNGAKAIITDIQIKKALLVKKVPCIYVKDLKRKHNNFLNYIFGNPLKGMKIIGVTGTDGKTSQVNLLAQSLYLCKKKVGIISSGGNGIFPKLKKTKYTTPRIDILFNCFQKFKEEKVNTVIIECSSQGLEQNRLNNINFDMSILTNIYKDHIDYHKSFKNYIKAKTKLLESTKKYIIMNSNLKNIIKKSDINKYAAKKIYFNITDYKKEFNNKNLFGHVNINNLLAIKIILKLYKINSKKIIQTLEKLKTVKGRNNYIKTTKNGTYIVDYAHTVSSLYNLLIYVNEFFKKNNKITKIITIFGCGGDRDIWKRKKMGNVASLLSDIIILTDDNPRNEKSSIILDHIKKGIINKNELYIIPSRKEAIFKAISIARKDDVVVIAGKGNENGIIYGNKFVEHNDIKILKAKFK